MKRFDGWVIGSAFSVMLALALDSHADISPYAAQRDAEIKALGTEEQAALLAGKGMGFAKAAELNGYPGPTHVLELADELNLDAAQREKSRRLFERMRATAREAGAQLIEEERVLDSLYATRSATAAKVEAQLQRIESVRTRLRALHLDAHLEQAALLTASQVARYAELRGYAPLHDH
jgi:Spy/CpxP family protein refolding chaperone